MLEIHRIQIADPKYAFLPELPQTIDKRAGDRTEDGVLEREAALKVG